MFYKKFNIRTQSSSDLGLEEMETVLVESIYYAESHVKSESRGNPYRVKSPNQFWRDEVRSLKDDWAKERADWAKKEAKMQAEIASLKEKADESAKWKQMAEDNDANCDYQRRRYFNEVGNHDRTQDELRSAKDEIERLKTELKKQEDQIADLNRKLACALGDVKILKEKNAHLLKVETAAKDAIHKEGLWLITSVGEIIKTAKEAAQKEIDLAFLDDDWNADALDSATRITLEDEWLSDIGYIADVADDIITRTRLAEVLDNIEYFKSNSLNSEPEDCNF